MKLLVLDNYDSFTFNLVHLAREILKCPIDVFRNDKISLAAVNKYDKILLSPGPGIPVEAGIMPEIVDRYSSSKSILGVCLGHQCIAEQFGGSLLNMSEVIHGKPAEIRLTDPAEKLFSGLGESFIAGRYHSWIIERGTLPECLKVTAETDNAEVMAIRHTSYDVQGIQFHPESILTPQGCKLLANWLQAE